jgi:hypothetical protein
MKTKLLYQPNFLCIDKKEEKKTETATKKEANQRVNNPHKELFILPF